MWKRKLKHRKAGLFARGHTVGKCQSQDVRLAEVCACPFLPCRMRGGPFPPDPTARGLRGHVTLNGHTSPILGLMPVLSS